MLRIRPLIIIMLIFFCVGLVSREYCANGRQHTQVCLLLTELSVDLSEFFLAYNM